MTTAPVKANLTSVSVATKDISPWTNNAVLKEAADKQEITAYGSVGHEFVGTLVANTFTASGWYDSTATTGTQDVLGGQQGVSQAVIFGPEGSTTGKPMKSFTAVLDDFTTTSAVADIVKWAATWTVSGVISTGTFT